MRPALERLWAVYCWLAGMFLLVGFATALNKGVGAVVMLAVVAWYPGRLLWRWYQRRSAVVAEP